MTDNTPETPAEDPEQRPAVPVVPRVLVFFDYACQFCYLDWPRFKRLRAEHELELFLIPFELRPALAAEGVSVADLGAAHSERVEEYMRRMASESGLELSFPSFVPNTHLALAMGEVARDAGPEVHERVHEAILSAYSASSEDIGNAEVLLRIATEQGLDPVQVSAAFAEGTYDERIHQFRHIALEMGITATPSALICNELLIGTRPYEVIAASLRRCLVGEDNVAEMVEARDDAEAAETFTPADS
jgi:predicted DsbA family dithiol-disulfide isomerase